MPTITINGREVHPDDIKVLSRGGVRVFVIWDFAEPVGAVAERPRPRIANTPGVIVGGRRR